MSRSTESRDAPPNGRATLPTSADLQTAIAQLGESSDLRTGDIARLFEEALVSTYRRFVEDDPSVRADVDLAEGTFALARAEREADGGGGGEGVGEADGDAGQETGHLDAVPVFVPVPGGDFLRQVAQEVRTVVATALKSAGQNRVVREVALRRGDLVDGIVERRGGAAWWLRIGDMLAVLPPEEQMPGEELVVRQHLKVVLLDSRRRTHDAVAVVSRSSSNLLRLLLEQEVPELQTGEVIIRSIVREAGRRSKVAVDSTARGVDPRGACIGPRGVRHRAVTSELGAEQVQIITWSDDEATLVANALAPAAVLAVELDRDTHTAQVTVASDQLSLAIGRSGENARLVARLTGWRIDIHAPATAS